MHCIIFPEPLGLLFLTKQQAFTRGNSSSEDWGCGKQIRLSTLKKQSFFTRLNFHLQLEVAMTLQKQRLHTESKTVQQDL